MVKINVRHLAQLANLELSEKEIDKFKKQLSSILDFVKKLQEVDTKNIEPTSQITKIENVFKNDQLASSLTQEEVISPTKNKHHGFFKVKAILEEQ